MRDTTVQALSDLTIRTSAPATAIAGASACFVYSLSVTDTAPSSINALPLHDALPISGTTFQTTGSSSECTAALQVVTCTRGVKLAGLNSSHSNIPVKVCASMANGTILDNTASVSSGGTAEGASTNNDSHTTHTTAPPL